jgi:peptide/nickel transport system substrate-binding protein
MPAAAAALLAVLALVAAACGSDDDEPAAGPAGTDAGAETTEAAGEPDPDGSFVYAYYVTLSRMDPHRASISQDGTTLFPAYDRLVHLAPDGELIPGLAESWEFSDDGLTLTMHLREGVTFHDGATFDAAAAKKNLDRAKTVEGSSVATDIATIESVSVVDDHTIDIAMSTPNVSIIGSLSDRAGIQVSPKALDDGVNLDEEMVGAAPFRFVSHVPGSTTKFERFEEYWGEKAKVKDLEIRLITDQVARLNAVSNGEIDGTNIGATQISEIEGNEDLVLTLNTELQYTYLVQNRARAGQDDVRVRQAMVHALDRQALCDTLYFGYCTITDQPFPPGYFAFNEDIPEVLYDHDPDRARELLAEAGVESMDLSYLIPAGLAPGPELAEAVQQMWAEVGINIDIQPQEPSKLGELMFAQEVADVMQAGWGGRPDPSITLAQRGTSAGFANPGGVSTPKLEELYLESISTSDPEERAEVLQEASREMAESVLEIVVLFPQVPYVTGSDVVGFTPFLSGKPEFRTVGVTG